MQCVPPDGIEDPLPLPPPDRALFDAVKANDLPAVAACLARGVDPTQERGDDAGKTPLIYALEGGFHDCARLLLDAGADVHLADRDYRSPLRVALHKQDIEAVRLLIDRGADPNFTAASKRADGTEYGSAVTDLIVASEGRPEIAKIVTDVAPKFQVCHTLSEAGANQRSDIPAIAALLENGTPLDIKDYNDRSALMYACFDRDEVLVKLLLECGANPNLTMRDGTTALFAACTGPSLKPAPEIIHLLLAHGANPHHVAPDGFTVMHAAARAGDEEAMKILAREGVSMTAKTLAGKTPADAAIEYPNPAAVPVIERVIRWNRQEEVKLIEKQGMKLEQPVKPLKRLRIKAPNP